MTREDAESTIERLGAKLARIALLERRSAEIEAEVARLRRDLEAMGVHAAAASEALESSR